MSNIQELQPFLLQISRSSIVPFKGGTLREDFNLFHMIKVLYFFSDVRFVTLALVIV